MSSDQENGPDRAEMPLGGVADQVQHLLAIGQHRRAREIAATWLSQDPGNPLALHVLSAVLLASREPEAALAAVEQAIAREPDNGSLLAQRGRALFVLGRFAAAERALQSAMSLEPEDPDLALLYARLLSQCERDREAIVQVERALELDPDSAEAHQLRSTLLLGTKMSRWGVSRASAERAAALDPEDPDSQAVLGAVHLFAGEIGQAEGRFRDALRLEPSHALARRGLAEALMARKPWYRPLLSFGVFMQTQSQTMRWMVILAPWAVVSAVNTALAGEPTAAVMRSLLVWSYYAFCAYTWFAEPITRRILARQYPWLAERF